MSQKYNKQSNQGCSFEDDLNQMVKKIKIKEEIIYQLIQYVQNIYAHKHQLEMIVFMQDQISKHSNFLNRIQSNFNSMVQYENHSIIQKYNKNYNTIISKSDHVLLKRVTAKILQLFQTFNEKVLKFHLFEQEIPINFKLYKSKIIKFINQIDKIDTNFQQISLIIKCFFQYSNSKFKDQIKKLRKIIQLIQNGQIYQLQNALKCQPIQQSKQTQLTSNSESHQQISKNVIEKNYQSIQVNKFINQKQKLTQKLKIMRRQSKQKQIITKKLKKFATKYYTLYQNAMQIHKNHFIDDLLRIDKKVHSQKILADILSRNKQNQEFIKQYVSVCEQKKYNQKQFIQLKTYSLDYYQQKKQRIQKIQILYQTNQQQDSDINKQSKFNSIISQDLNDIRSFRISNSKKSIATTPNSNTNLFVLNACNNSYNFVKLNVKNIKTDVNTIRSKLPGITNRLFSMQDKRKSTGKIVNKQIYVHQSNVIKGLQLKSIQFKGVKKYQSGHGLQKKSTLTLDSKKNSEYIISKKLNKYSQIISQNQQLIS